MTNKPPKGGFIHIGIMKSFKTFLNESDLSANDILDIGSSALLGLGTVSNRIRPYALAGLVGKGALDLGRGDYTSALYDIGGALTIGAGTKLGYAGKIKGPIRSRVYRNALPWLGTGAIVAGQLLPYVPGFFAGGDQGTNYSGSVGGGQQYVSGLAKGFGGKASDNDPSSFVRDIAY